MIQHSRARRAGVGSIVFALAAAATLLVSGAPGAAAAGSNTLTITAGEYAYSLKGKPQPGWVTLEFKNGGVEYHMVAIIELKKGVTTAQLKKAAVAQDDAAFAKVAKGEGTVSGIPSLLGPNQQTTTITQMKAGHYGLLCFVPAPDGSPHVAHGMVTTFDVAGSKSSAQPPKDGVLDVTLTDTSIKVPPGDAPKSATIKVTNQGTSPHSFTIVKVESGKTLDDVKKYFDTFFDTGKAPAGAAPGTIVGGVDQVAPGAASYLEWALPPGHYAYVSTDGDAPNDDYTKGMHGEFDIK